MNSFNISDIILILFLALCFYFYYNKGLVMTLFGFCTTIFSLVLSRFISPFLAGFLRHTSIFENIKSYISETILSSGTGTGTEFIETLSIPEFLKSNISETIQTSNTADYVSGYIASFAINIIAMIIIFALFIIVFSVLANVLKVVSHLPVIKTANKLGGGLVGLAEGIIVVWIIFAVFTMLYGKPMFNGINESISNSLIASKFYDSNILIKGLSAINNLL